MTQITYTAGDATLAPPHSIIAHICNNRGGWGKGFSGALSKRWRQPEARYREYVSDQYLDVLGSVQFVWVQKGIYVANMIAQDGYSKPGRPAISYNALELCLGELCKFARGYSVQMPRIGTGLAGGDWAVIEPMIVRELCERGVGVTVYDLPT